MKSFRYTAYCIMGVVICAMTLFLACLVQPDTAELANYVARENSAHTDTQQHLNAADNAIGFAIEVQQEISVPSSTSVRVLRTSSSRILPALHQQQCRTLAKSASFFNSRHLCLYDVAAPFACASMKDYFIYALRRIII